MGSKEKSGPLNLYLTKHPAQWLTSDGQQTGDLQPDWESLWWEDLCHQRLFSYSSEGIKMQLIKSCEISLDRTVYRLQVRKNRFLPGGVEISSQVVVEHLQQRLTTPLGRQLLGAFLTAAGPHFRVRSRSRFELHLRKPCSDLLERLAQPLFSFPKHDWKWCGEVGCLEQVEALEHEPSLMYQPVWMCQAPSEGEFDSYLERRAFGFLFPGTARKVPQAAQIYGHCLQDAGAGFTMVALPVGQGAKERLAVAAPLLQRALHELAKQSDFHLQLSFSLVDQGHSYYRQWQKQRPRMSQDMLTLALVWDPQYFSRSFFSALHKVAKRLGLEIDVTDYDGADAADVAVILLPRVQQGDNYTLPLWLLQREARQLLPIGVEQKLSRCLLELARENGEFGARRLFNEACGEIGLLPLAKVPLLLFANRRIHPRVEGEEFLGPQHFQEPQRVKQARDLEAQRLLALGKALPLFAHDLKKPFSMIQGYFNMLSRSEDPMQVQDYARRFTPDIRKTLSMVDRLIGDLMEAGADHYPAADPVDMRLVLEDSLKEVFSFQQSLVELRYDIRLGCLVSGDAGKLRRALSNLVTNGFEANGEKGWMEFSLAECEEQGRSWVVFRVRNSESYIPPAQRELLFEMFHSAGKESGTGLGLAIVRKIAEAHGGYVDCSSQIGLGTTFTLCLPAGERMTEIEAGIEIDWPATPSEVVADGMPCAHLAVAACSRSVVIVDDDPFFLEAMADAARGSGVDLHCLLAPEELFHMAEQPEGLAPFDAVVTDLYFGGRELGLEVARRLGPRIPVYLASDAGAAVLDGASQRLFQQVLSKEPDAVLQSLQRHHH